MDEQRQLVRFVQRVEELRSLKMVKDKVGYKVDLNVDSIKGASMTARFPDEEVLRSFLLTFRQFMAKSEPVYVSRILNICWKRMKPNSRLKEHIIHARKVWSDALRANNMGLVYNEKELSPEYVADLWMNGHYFHNDDAKSVALERMLGYEQAFVKAHFVEFLIQATYILTYTGNVVAYALKNKMLQF